MGRETTVEELRRALYGTLLVGAFCVPLIGLVVAVNRWPVVILSLSVLGLAVSTIWSFVTGDIVPGLGQALVVSGFALITLNFASLLAIPDIVPALIGGSGIFLYGGHYLMLPESESA